MAFGGSIYNSSFAKYVEERCEERWRRAADRCESAERHEFEVANNFSEKFERKHLMVTARADDMTEQEVAEVRAAAGWRKRIQAEEDDSPDEDALTAQEVAELSAAVGGRKRKAESAIDLLAKRPRRE